MPLDRWIHRLRDNHRSGSRRNIAAHYDLGNDFYALFLDDTMTYSCGVFESPDATLSEASTAKYERICRGLGLRPEHEVVEIGCGWGGFAEHAAGRYGCRVAATTISDRQFEYASERVRRAGLGDRVTILQEDYRDLPKRLGRRFDRLVSIEMIEAVGHRHMEAFFRTCQRLLREDGLMALQAITIADQRYDAYRRSVDFIQRHIFPGGFLPSVTAITRTLTRATDLTTVALEDIGRHYAETLHRWRERFLARRDDVAALGLPDRFVRMWEFYLAYCEGGFLERTISDVQMILARPRARLVPEGGMP